MNSGRISPCLIEVDDLQQQLSNPSLVVLHTDMQPIGFEVVTQPEGCIPGALNVDVNKDISDTSKALPHSLPTEDQFTALMQRLGVSEDSYVVVYDDYGLYSSPRLWWMLKAMGHKHVSVLNGGLPAWKSAGYPVQSVFSEPEQSGNFVARFNVNTIITADEIRDSLESRRLKVIDARSEERFLGLAPEPRAGLRGGHIPHSINISFQECLKAGKVIDGKIMDRQDLLQLFDSKNIPADADMVFSCGSGVTACIPLLAATLCGYPNLRLYDGSWSEWGGDSAFPVE